MPFTVATWNVNSIRMRLTHIADWLKANRPDVLCLQETKVQDADFPHEPFEDLGYVSSVYGQKSYNGVAILSYEDQHDVRRGFPDDGDDAQRRLIAATISGVRVISVYIPNGEGLKSPKFTYKLEFLDRLEKWIAEAQAPDDRVLLCGDYNIAPADLDLFDPKGNRETVMFHSKEHAVLERLRAWGLRDVVREGHPDEEGLYSWWDYRTGGFPRNRGWRIDHIWATAPLADRCAATRIDRDERGKDKPSDHVPVVASFELT